MTAHGGPSNHMQHLTHIYDRTNICVTSAIIPPYQIQHQLQPPLGINQKVTLLDLGAQPGC